MFPRTASLLAVIAPLLAGCSGSGEPRAAGPLDADAFAEEAPAVVGRGTVDLRAFADRDLVVWFWSPW